jgi:chorismate lyase
LKPRPVDRALRAWLRCGGSLSQQLLQAFGRFEVQLLRQGPGALRPDELKALRQANGRAVRTRRCHVREVVLWADGQPLVVARSVLPAVQAGLAWAALRGLGNRPLADLLFGLRAARCDRLGCGHLPPLLARRQVARLALVAAPCWFRRSVFTRRGVPLLVTECFVPGVRARFPAATRCRSQRSTR